jgi:excisionase family DNA binding protein
VTGPLEPIVTAIIDELVPRLAAELAASLPAPAVEESWRLVSLEEAAERLGRSTRWVREQVKKGGLAYVRLDGGSLRFEVADLRRFAADHRVDACAPLAGVPDSAWTNGSDTGHRLSEPEATGR